MVAEVNWAAAYRALQDKYAFLRAVLLAVLLFIAIFSSIILPMMVLLSGGDCK